MGQVIHTKNYGAVEFDRTWVNADGLHIGLLSAGGYAYLSGKPVDNRQDLIDLMPKGPDQKAALKWFDNRDKVKETSRSIMLNPDGSYSWSDGEEIKSDAEIMNALPAGPQQEAVLLWFVEKQKAVSEGQKAQDADTKATVKDLKDQVDKKTKGKK